MRKPESRSPPVRIATVSTDHAPWPPERKQLPILEASSGIPGLETFLPVLWTTALMLHLGRPYVLRTLRRCGLRLGADIWWMSYLLIRDAVLLITLGVSWFYFDPNLVATLSFPLTGPLAALFLLLALAVKMTRRVDDDVNAYRLATVFLVIGAMQHKAAARFDRPAEMHRV